MSAASMDHEQFRVVSRLRGDLRCPVRTGAQAGIQIGFQVHLPIPVKDCCDSASGAGDQHACRNIRRAGPVPGIVVLGSLASRSHGMVKDDVHLGLHFWSHCRGLSADVLLDVHRKLAG